MRRRQTVAVAALAAAVAVLAGCGGDGETSPAATPAAAATTEAATEPGTTAEPETEGATTAEADTAAETQPEGDDAGGEKADAVIKIEGGEPVGGPATVEVKKGDPVRIVVRSDAEDELHLHGYEIEKTVGPGKPAIFAFTAEFEGIFELEAHHADTLVARVVVEP